MYEEENDRASGTRIDDGATANRGVSGLPASPGRMARETADAPEQIGGGSDACGDGAVVNEIGSYVYVMQGHGRCKVGISGHPATRLLDLQRGKYPDMKRVSYAAPYTARDAAKIESAVHCALRHQRVVGEVFSVTEDEAIECVKSIAIALKVQQISPTKVSRRHDAISVRIEVALKVAAETLAKADRRTLSAWVEALIAREVAKKSRKPLTAPPPRAARDGGSSE